MTTNKSVERVRAHWHWRAEGFKLQASRSILSPRSGEGVRISTVRGDFGVGKTETRKVTHDRIFKLA